MKYREEFQTEAEALAFIRGVEYLDNDHVRTEGPSPEMNDMGGIEHVVYVEEFC